MCNKHVHKNLISPIHSVAEKEFFYDGGQSVSDDDNVRVKRRDLIKNDVNSLIALGDALAHQMRYNEALACYVKARDLQPENYICHRKCAIRFMSVLDIDAAQREFLWCAQKTGDKLDIEYRLALCAYYKGDYRLAKQRIAACYALCDGNGEMYVAVLYWHIQCLVRLGEDIEEALKFFREDLDGGHHIGYMQTVRLFLTEDLSVINLIDADDELNLSIYGYGLYAFLLHKGKAREAACELDKTLGLDTYFSSFAYLGAYCEKKRLREIAFDKLEVFFKDNPKLALAFSGGTDSALLLSTAKRLDTDVKAYFACSRFQPDFEVDDAVRLAKIIGAKCEFIDVDVLSDASIAKNDRDRCYYCKRKMFEAITACAKRDGYDTVIDGTNFTDDLQDRPGVRALKEYRVRSPLLESGITKSDVRHFSKIQSLFTWNKPSYSCLATRVKNGEELTEDKLMRIERAERALMDRGYINFRVRYADRCAKIEVDKTQNVKFQSEKQQIYDELSEYFDIVEQSNILR